MFLAVEHPISSPNDYLFIPWLWGHSGVCLGSESVTVPLVCTMLTKTAWVPSQ